METSATTQERSYTLTFTTEEVAYLHLVILAGLNTPGLKRQAQRVLNELDTKTRACGLSILDLLHAELHTLGILPTSEVLARQAAFSDEASPEDDDLV